MRPVRPTDRPVGPLGPLRRAEGWLLRLLDGALIVALCGMIAVVSAQVLSRYVLGTALIWSEEVARHLFISLVFLGSAVLARHRSHLAVTVFVDLLPERLRHLADAIASAVGVGVAWLLVRGAWATLLREWDQRTPGLQFPMGAIFTLILVSMALLFVWLILATLSSLRDVWRDAPHTRSIGTM